MSFHRDDFPKKNVYFYDGHQIAIMFELDSLSNPFLWVFFNGAVKFLHFVSFVKS
jgi:hypothetical protein